MTHNISTMMALAEQRVRELQALLDQAVYLRDGLLALQVERDDLVAIAGLQAKRLQDTLEASVIEEPVDREPVQPEQLDNRGEWVYLSSGERVPKYPGRAAG